MILHILVDFFGEAFSGNFPHRFYFFFLWWIFLLNDFPFVFYYFLLRLLFLGLLFTWCFLFLLNFFHFFRSFPHWLLLLWLLRWWWFIFNHFLSHSLHILWSFSNWFLLLLRWLFWVWHSCHLNCRFFGNGFFHNFRFLFRRWFLIWILFCHHFGFLCNCNLFGRSNDLILILRVLWRLSWLHNFSFGDLGFFNWNILFTTFWGWLFLHNLFSVSFDLHFFIGTLSDILLDNKFTLLFWAFLNLLGHLGSLLIFWHLGTVLLLGAGDFLLDFGLLLGRGYNRNTVLLLRGICLFHNLWLGCGSKVCFLFGQLWR